MLVSVNFDKLGLTDNQNPIGLLPFLQPFLDMVGSGK
jgi:hypothetical protein